jgi:16S rRNA A1518/A1519 N6-dimethyltransferase RsmA/KsgA/DIM1 with predicted DNA glycosylase/AP lyase activity
MILELILGVSLLTIFLIWFSGFFFGAPFETSSNRAMRSMLLLSEVKKGDRVAELGSGNGKLVIEFAKRGAKVTGFEINPFLVWISRRKIKKLGLENFATIERRNFMKADLSKFDILSIFQINYVMDRIEKRLKSNLKGKRVVSNTWKFPGIKETKRIGHVFLYKF